ncbi:MAG: bacillithiol system redox-active protein YtxJ [Lacibacter sp.]
MVWIDLSTPEELEQLILDSQKNPQLIFKHSTRCSISSVAKSRIEKSQIPEGYTMHYLDLIRYRSLSNLIAEKFRITHESPQLLVIAKGLCVYHESHLAISINDAMEALEFGSESIEKNIV